MRDADTIIQESFLPTRAKLLELAATFDRIDRARDDQSAVSDLSDLQLKQLTDAIAILTQSRSTSRAESMQRLFSRSYDPDWKQQFGIASSANQA